MKILMINNHHYMMGGSEKVYFETAKILEEKGHQVIYFSTQEGKTIPNTNSNFFVKDPQFKNSSLLKKIKNGFRFIYSIEAKEKLTKLIEKEKPDIAHLHIFYGNLTSSILPVLKKNNIPMVMSVHEYRMLCPTYLMLDQNDNICELCAKGNYLNCIQNKCNNGSYLFSAISAIECFIRDYLFSYEKYIDKFIMVSNFINKKHLEYKPSLRNKTIHLYNFLDIQEYKINTQQEMTNFLYIGRLSKEKGIFTLIKAFKKFPQLRLKIAGEGNIKNDLINYINDHKIENIEFLGFLNSNQIKEVQANSSFLIIPSEWYENNPMVAIEALAMGIPIIGANIGGIPELIKNNTNGFLFDSKNIDDLVEIIKKASLLSNKEYNNLSINARSFAEENFDKNQHYNKLITIYNDLCKDKNE